MRLKATKKQNNFDFSIDIKFNLIYNMLVPSRKTKKKGEK